MRFRYRNIFNTDPKGLFCKVFFRPLGGKSWKELNAQIDTGADISILPKCLENDYIHSVKKGRVKSIGNGRYNEMIFEHQSFYFEFSFDKQRLFQIETVFIEKEEYALIGRDILNSITLIAEGKKGKFEILY